MWYYFSPGHILSFWSFLWLLSFTGQLGIPGLIAFPFLHWQLAQPLQLLFLNQMVLYAGLSMGGLATLTCWYLLSLTHVWEVMLARLYECSLRNFQEIQSAARRYRQFTLLWLLTLFLLLLLSWSLSLRFRSMENGRNNLPQGSAYQLVIQYEILSPQSINTSDIIQTEKIILMNIQTYAYAHAIKIKEKKVMKWKVSRSGIWEDLG